MKILTTKNEVYGSILLFLLGITLTITSIILLLGSKENLTKIISMVALIIGIVLLFTSYRQSTEIFSKIE